MQWLEKPCYRGKTLLVIAGAQTKLEVEEVVVISMTPYRRPVAVSLWPDSLCSVCYEILVLCSLYKEL